MAVDVGSQKSRSLLYSLDINDFSQGTEVCVKTGYVCKGLCYVRNDDIRKALSISSVEENIHAYRRKRIDQLLRTNEELVSRQPSCYTAVCKSTRSRSRKRWGAGIGRGP